MSELIRSFDGQYAYIGIWTNWSKWPVLGLMLTLTHKQGAFLTLFLTLLITLPEHASGKLLVLPHITLFPKKASRMECTIKNKKFFGIPTQAQLELGEFFD